MNSAMTAARLPCVLYSHPDMRALAEAVVNLCSGHKDQLDKNGESHRCCGVELKDSIKWKKFPDGWPNLFIEDVKKDCAGRDVLFIGSLHSPEKIFEQVSILYAMPRYLSRSVTFILPYFPTATMERIDAEGTVATASTMARILSAIPLSARGPCRIVIFDIHALQERFYFGDNVIPRLETAIPLLLHEIRKRELANVSIAFPDDGALKRFQSQFADHFPLITCLKIRDGNQRVVKIKEGDARGRHCIIVDDLAMTGGTLIECSKALRLAGATHISAFVTHAVFPDLSWRRFTQPECGLDDFYITDSIPHATEIARHRPFVLLSLAGMIADVLLGFDLLQT